MRKNVAATASQGTMQHRRVLGLLLVAACHTTPSAGEATTAIERAELQVQVLRLTHVPAEDLVQVVAEVLGQGSSGCDLKLVAKADQNALVVSGTSEQIREVKNLVARLDVPSTR